MTDRRRYNAPSDKNEIGQCSCPPTGKYHPCRTNASAFTTILARWRTCRDRDRYQIRSVIRFYSREVHWAINMQLSSMRGKWKRITMRKFFVLTGEMISGTHRREYHIPRLDLFFRDCHFPFKLKRRHFPVKVCFAMTINKAQGQTFRRVGIYLPQFVFAFGQLYVAFSITVNFVSVKVQLDETPVQGRGDPRVLTRNLAPLELLRRLEQQRQLPSFFSTIANLQI